MTKIHPETNSLVDSFKEEMQKEAVVRVIPPHFSFLQCVVHAITNGH
jgi:hypothetical protein